ncbi:MAG: hypothetical protein WCK51_01595 [Armatimonadota bacterium]
MKNSESVFEQYLKYWRLEFEHEKPIEGSKPDFSCWTSSGEPIVYWEIADRLFTEEDKRDLDELFAKAEHCEGGVTRTGPSKGYQFLEKKIRRKSEQFRKCGPVPGMLVVADWTHTADIDHRTVASVLYGWPQVRFTLHSDEPAIRFGRAEDGKLNDPDRAHLNTHFSAIGVLKEVNPNRVKYGLDEYTESVISTYIVTSHAFELIAKREREIGSCHDLTIQVPALDIYVIPDAPISWPLEYVGELDTLYLFDSEADDFVERSRREQANTQVPMSVTQRAISSLMSDPSLRND